MTITMRHGLLKYTDVSVLRFQSAMDGGKSLNQRDKMGLPDLGGLSDLSLIQSKEMELPDLDSSGLPDLPAFCSRLLQIIMPQVFSHSNVWAVSMPLPFPFSVLQLHHVSLLLFLVQRFTTRLTRLTTLP